jgi:hypothetical protein
MKSIRAKANLLVDVAIGVAFMVEVISGWVLWQVLPRGGFQGGRNLDYGRTVLVGRDTWLGLHDWFALIMVVGVVVHLALHWRWIVCMARNIWRQAFPVRAPLPKQAEDCPV